jgi:uncharacterized protein
MAIFNFLDESAIGSVFSVDTATVVVNVEDDFKLRRLQVHHLLAIKSAKAGQHLIGIISRITRKLIGPIPIPIIEIDEGNDDHELTINILNINLIGTLVDKHLKRENVFKRTIETVPEIDAKCFPIEGEDLTRFMQTLSKREEFENPLSLGHYSINENAEAFLDGNKLFQRHAVIVGSTGSGKSWCVAKIIEQVANLPSANCILFDIHGEYSGESFQKNGIQRLRIANPSDLGKRGNLENGVLMLPYWLLTYEEMLAMLLDRSDNNAPNQAMIFSRTVFEKKQQFLIDAGDSVYSPSITIDSPIPYDMAHVKAELTALDEELVPGSKAGSEKQGPFYSKLSRFIQRLEAKTQDKRMGFMFQISADEMKLEWMEKMCSQLMESSLQNDKKAGVKIIDFSEVPSDVLPLVIGLVARVIFSVQQWTPKEKRHPLCLFCDEAHLYIPERTSHDAASELGLKSFERIAKEGRKYGISLMVISQRPAEVNKTVLSQCNNFISMRLSNADDQSVVKRLLPDNLAGLTEVLPILDIGEALVVGDSILLPTRIVIAEPNLKPSSATIDFWTNWNSKVHAQDIAMGVASLRLQSKP